LQTPESSCVPVVVPFSLDPSPTGLMNDRPVSALVKW